ncbi:MAG: hypothetical protein U0Q11_08850 [Vicinamibacterales bacterium]
MRHCIVVTLVVLLSAVSARAGDDPWFAHDKALHAAAGAALGAGGYGTGALVFTSTRARIGVGLGVALGAGAAKEWHDRGGRGTPSWRDFAWDGVGAAAGVGVAWLIDRAHHTHDTKRSALVTRANTSGLASMSTAVAAWSPVTADRVLGSGDAAGSDSRPYLGDEGWALCCSVTR